MDLLQTFYRLSANICRLQVCMTAGAMYDYKLLLCLWALQQIPSFADAERAKLWMNTKKVIILLNSFCDPHIDSYIKNNKTHILADGYLFKNFLSDLCKRFLSPWAMDLYHQAVLSKMLSNKTFKDFCTHVIAGKNLLEGDPPPPFS